MVFLSKFEMPICIKVVSLNKMDNFPKGRILSVLVNFGERGKSSERQLWALKFKGFDQVFGHGLAPEVCPLAQKVQ
jgi:hypothetical protein